MALAPSWVLMRHLLKLKCAHSPLNLRILSSTSVPFILTTVQVPNLALTYRKRITVYTEFVQNFRLQGEFTVHRRLSAAWHKFDMAWLNRLLIPVGRRGYIYSFKWFLPAFAALRGGGGQHPVAVSDELYSLDKMCGYDCDLDDNNKVCQWF